MSTVPAGTLREGRGQGSGGCGSACDCCTRQHFRHSCSGQRNVQAAGRVKGVQHVQAVRHVCSSMLNFVTPAPTQHICSSVLKSLSPPHLSSTYWKILSGRPVMPIWRTRPCALSASSAGSVSFTIWVGREGRQCKGAWRGQAVCLSVGGACTRLPQRQAERVLRGRAYTRLPQRL